LTVYNIGLHFVNDSRTDSIAQSFMAGIRCKNSDRCNWYLHEYIKVPCAGNHYTSSIYIKKQTSFRVVTLICQLADRVWFKVSPQRKSLKVKGCG